MKQLQKLSKFIIPAFYLIAMILVVLYALNEETRIRRGGSTPLYQNLMEYPAYIRRGFDPEDILKLPPADSRDWVRFESSPPRVADSPLPNMPNRIFLSPFGFKDEEFTIIIPVEIDADAKAFLDGDYSVIPGIYFANIGENWQVYFNGVLVQSEMYLDDSKQIIVRRTWRSVYFPIDDSLFTLGTNILALRIVGDPSYRATGLTYSTPHYIEDYRIIEHRNQNFLFTLLCGIFALSGICYIMVFLFIRKKSEIYYLWFGIYSLLLFAYAFTRSSMVNIVIPNSDISIRLEYFSLIFSVPAFCIFVETIFSRKVTRISKVFIFFCVFLALSQFLFSAQYGEEVIRIWNVTAILYFTVIFGYTVYLFFAGRHKVSKAQLPADEVSQTLISNVMIGIFAIYSCGVYEFIAIMFFEYFYNLFTYSAFVVQIIMTLALFARYSGMYKRLQDSNIILETTVKKRTRELEEQTEIAVSANRAKSEFLATMSHEIRTPLNAIIGLSEIELRNRLDESSRDNITQVYQSGSFLMGIINDILDISKIETGNIELVTVEYETASMISDVVNLNIVRLGSKPLDFILEISGDFPKTLFGDELRVKQILNNLLSNAIKYTKEGKITLTVSTCEVRNNDQLTLSFSVRDTGIGIRTEDMGKLFQSYTQIDAGANRRGEGTGLGLVIIKKLVEMMGGSITVETAYGKGSCFTAKFIQGIADSSGIGEETASNLRNFQYIVTRKEKKIDYPQLPNAKALIVDDVPANLLVFRKMLAPYGMRVDVASSGQDAIEKIKNENFTYDLVFMDHMMPEMDGVQTTESIRSLKKNSFPVIAVTANAMRGMREYYLEQGFDDYLSKPISPDYLHEIIIKWIKTDNSEQIINNNENYSPIIISQEIDTVRIDKLKHFRAAFESGREIEPEYFIRFTALLESINFSADSDELRTQAAVLTEAGRLKDAQKIREILKLFCEALEKAHGFEKETDDETMQKILSRLKNALTGNESTGTIIAELGSLKLNSTQREMYFLLYDLLLEGKAEKAIDAIYFWERFHETKK